MCERDERCPTLADMERASDGELSSPAERDALDAHLRRCPACREQMRARAALLQMLGATLSTTPDAASAPRRAARAARFQQQLHLRKQAHIHRRTVTRPLARWLSVAAIGPLIMLGLLFTRPNTAIVHADELLTRAVTFDGARPAGSMQRVRITLTQAYSLAPRRTSSPRIGLDAPDAAGARGAGRYAPFLVVRDLVDGVGAEPWPSPVSAAATASTAITSADETAIAQLLARHHMNWRTPLGIEPVRVWRAGLRTKRDHVTRDGPDEWMLRTTTEEGLLREVRITVRRETFHVTRQVWVFDGIGQVEIEELAEWRRTTAPAPASALVAAAAPSAPLVTLPDPDALQRAELDARLVLRDAGADLGGSVRVSSTPEQVQVEGRLSSAAVRRALTTRLAAFPLVRVSLTTGDANSASSAAPTSLSAVTPGTASPSAYASAPTSASTTNSSFSASSAAAATAAAAADASSVVPVAPVSPSTSAAADAARGASVVTSVAPGVGPGSTPRAGGRPALHRWLDRTFGNEPSDVKATFVPQFEALTQTVTQRLEALDALAARYAAPGAVRLSPEARAKLQRLLDLHYRALNADLHALDARRAVLFGSTERTVPAAGAPADWMRRTDSGLTHARTLARLLDTLLTRDDLPSGETRADDPRGIDREFDALWEAVNAAPTAVSRPD